MEYRANPQNWDAAQDTNGILYFANTDGILMYNGAKWSLIKTKLKSNVRSVVLGGDKKIYVGGQSEFGYLASDTSGNKIFVSLSDNLPDSLKKFTDVWSVKSLNNNIYFLATERLFRYNCKTGKILSWKSSKYFYWDFIVHNQLYVFESHIGILKVDDNALKLIKGGEKFKNFTVYSVLPYKSDTVMVCTFRHGLLLFNGERLWPLKTNVNTFLDKQEVYYARILPDSTYLFTTLRGGVINMDRKGNIIRILNKKSGLQDNDVLNAFVDRDNNVWLMHENGLSKVEWFSPVSYFSDKEYGIQGAIYSIIRFKGYLYAATGIGVFRMQPGKTSFETKRNVFKQVKGINTQVWELHDFNGQLLAATTDGVYQIEGLKSKSILTQLCFTLYQSRYDSSIVYAGLSHGFARFKEINKKWVMVNDYDNIANEIRSIYQDKRNSVWLGTDYQGVAKVTLTDTIQRIQHFGKNNHLPAGYNELIPFHDDFFITTEKGLFKAYKSSNDQYQFRKVNLFKNNNNIESTVDHPIDNIIPDKSGNAWIVTSDSLGYATKTGKDKYQYHPWPYHLFNNFGIEAVYLDHNGFVWFGGEGMLIRYDPKNKWTGFSNYKILITEIQISKEPDENESIQKDENKLNIHPGFYHNEFKYEFKNFRFNFAAPTFIHESKIMYRYRLMGYSPKWSRWIHSNFKEYTNLSYGTYTFIVEARNELGVISNPARYHFSIDPPWYLNLWMMSMYIIFMGGFVFSGKKFRDSYVKRRTMYLEAVIKERTNEVKAKNMKLEESNRSLTDLNELKSEFLSMASHDLKNPISGIQGITKIMLDDLNGVNAYDSKIINKHIHALNLMHDSSKYMVNIINNLMDTTNIESGKILFKPDIVNINELINRIIQQNYSHSNSKNIAVLYEPQSEIIISLDEYRTHQIIENILDNAIKYSPRSSKVLIKTNHNTEKLESGLRIMIRDSGPGLTDEDKKGLFLKFNRLSARPTGGEASTGLGLFITKSLVDLQGGVLWVESEPGKGATFIVELPENNDMFLTNS